MTSSVRTVTDVVCLTAAAAAVARDIINLAALILIRDFLALLTTGGGVGVHPEIISVPEVPVELPGLRHLHTP